MYKVFIENREVNFRNKEGQDNSEHVIFVDSKVSFEKDLIQLIGETPENKIVTVISDSVKKVWENLKSECKFVQAAGGIVQREDEFLFI